MSVLRQSSPRTEMTMPEGQKPLFRRNMAPLDSPSPSASPPLQALSGTGFLFPQNSSSSPPLYLTTGGSGFNGPESSVMSPLSSMSDLQSGLWSSRQNTDPFGNFRASLQNGELSCLADSLAREFYSARQVNQAGSIGTSAAMTNPCARDIANANNNGIANNGRLSSPFGRTHGTHGSSDKHAVKTDQQPRRGSVSSSASSSESFELVTYATQAQNGAHNDRTSTPPDSNPEGLNVSWSAVVQRNPRPVKARSGGKHSRASKTLNVKFPACCTNPRIKISCTGCNEESFVKVTEEVKPRLIPVSTSQLGFCRFCQTNGDPPEVYQSHSLRSDDGRVTCPVLREYNCPICNNGGGDFAHTIKYCPLARKSKPGQCV